MELITKNKLTQPMHIESQLYRTPHSQKYHEFKWRNKLNKEMNEKIHFLYEISKGFL